MISGTSPIPEIKKSFIGVWVLGFMGNISVGSPGDDLGCWCVLLLLRHLFCGGMSPLPPLGVASLRLSWPEHLGCSAYPPTTSLVSGSGSCVALGSSTLGPVGVLCLCCRPSTSPACVRAVLCALAVSWVLIKRQLVFEPIN